jgi:hypothetical protein
MTDKQFARRIGKYVAAEIEQAAKFLKHDNLDATVRHLELARVLGQTETTKHPRVHWLMLKIGWRPRSAREIFGQIFRFGGANVSSFRQMPIHEDLQAIITKAKIEEKPL